ncbi:MAG: electron transport complex subunit RsxE [Defluviitaleaceae bacterium]|nr:electron transport complex subunit RsxE [Defluviitaleaceae bacterium]
MASEPLKAAADVVSAPKEKTNYKGLFTAGIWKENPVFKMFLSLCPALGTTVSVFYGFSMGIIILLAVTLSSLTVSIFGRFIPDEIRVPVLITIIAGVVTIVEMLTQAFLPGIHGALGAFIALVVVNCIIMGRAEAFAMKNKPMAAVADAMGYGLGIVLAFTIIAAVRELLGVGAILGIQIFPQQFAISLFALPMGAFIALALILGVITTIQLRKNDEKLAKERAEKAAKAAAAKAKAAGTPAPVGGV